MNISLKQRLKPGLLLNNIKEFEGIPLLLNPGYMTGNNSKYMKMYDWMSRGYDFAESFIGRLKYGNTINEMRKQNMSRLEWKDNSSVLYVSIGTGTDLQFIPGFVNRETIDIVGVDISLGMLKKCKNKFGKNSNLSLVNCCAEDLPFKDNEFDVVFHIGGINFFNDKSLAIREMIRVAKKGTKILIADETEAYLEKQYKKSRLSKKFFQDQKFDLQEIESAIPPDVTGKKTELMWEERFYCITFRK